MKYLIYNQKDFKLKTSGLTITQGVIDINGISLFIKYTSLGIHYAQPVVRYDVLIKDFPENIVLVGSEFQIKVWKFILDSKSGDIYSYSDIAKHLNMKNHARAVAKALSSNQIAYFVPCHRVINKDGSISGYKWGVEMKKKLLEKEQK